MDVTLPKLTGFEASAAIRALEDGVQAVPIIAVLPQAFDRDREACIEAGMNDVILKPISPEALDAVFQRYLLSDEDEIAAEAWPVS
ncbi:hybrid sensory histidine kinase BarA [compost metagenome]